MVILSTRPATRVLVCPNQICIFSGLLAIDFQNKLVIVIGNFFFISFRFDCLVFTKDLLIDVFLLLVQRLFPLGQLSAEN